MKLCYLWYCPYWSHFETAKLPRNSWKRSWESAWYVWRWRCTWTYYGYGKIYVQHANRLTDDQRKTRLVNLWMTNVCNLVFRKYFTHCKENEIRIWRPRANHICLRLYRWIFISLWNWTSCTGTNRTYVLYINKNTGQSISSIGRVPIEILPGKRHIT